MILNKALTLGCLILCYLPTSTTTRNYQIKKPKKKKKRLTDDATLKNLTKLNEISLFIIKQFA